MTRSASSWQTTAAGVAAAVGSLLAFVLPLLDVQLAEGKIDEAAGAIVFLVGLLWGAIAARDDGVSSEGWRAPKAHLWLLLLLPAMLVVPGCSGPRFGSSDTGLNVDNASASVQRTRDINGNVWETMTYGDTPSHIVADAGGLNQAASGPHRTMSIAMESMVITITDPLDGSLKGLRFTTSDGTSLDLDEFISQPSVTIAAKEAAIIQSLATQGLITQEQAGVWTTLIEAGSSSLVDLIAGLGG